MIKNWLQKKFINILVKHLFNTIGKDDILKIVQRGSRKIVVYRGKELEPETIIRLKESADAFANSMIWKVIKDEVRYRANRRMFIRSQTADDILAGKIALYVLDIIDSKIQEISEL